MYEDVLYVGIDLGDKTTSMFYANSGRSDSVNTIQLPGCIGTRPLETTVCKLRSGEIRLADSLSYYELDEIEQVYSNFKYQPDVVKVSNPSLYRTMAQGINAFLRAIFESYEFKELMRPLTKGKSRIVFCVGYPTNWPECSVQEYKKLIIGENLKTYGVNQSTVFAEKSYMGIPMELRFEKESTAAYVFINNINMKERKWKVTSGGNVLVLDFGSSTVNITALGKDSRYSLYSSGNNGFGGRQLDAVIAMDCLSSLPMETKKLFYEFNKPNSVNVTRLLVLAASHLKEKLSSQEKCKEPFDCLDTTFRYNQNKLYHTAYNIPMSHASQFMLDEMTQDSEVSWAEALKSYLSEERDKIKCSGIRPELIILTGGGAAMPITQAICEKIFGKVQALDASETQCVIAQGLALAAKNSDRSGEFKTEVQKFIDQELPCMINKEMSSLINSVSRDIMDQICSKMKYELTRWRDGHLLTIRCIKQNIRNMDYAAIAKSYSVRSSVERWYKNTMCRTINTRLDVLCRKYGVRSFSLPDYISFNLDDLNFFCNISDIEAEMLLGVIGGLAIILVGLMALTPLGVPILVSLGIAVLTEWGRNQIDDLILKIQDYKFPQFFRKLVSDRKILKIISDNEKDIEKAIKSSITSNSTNISVSLKNQIARQIEEKMVEIQFELR